MNDLYDAVIVGGGAAGLNAALVLGRSCRSALICDDGRPRNAVVDRMHGFLSRDGTSPRDLLQIARRELESYPKVLVKDTHVTHALAEEGTFRIRTADGEEFVGRRLLLAIGVYDALPEIRGLRERWGRSVFVCPYCDAWEVRRHRLAILGNGRKAVELAQELHQWSDDIVVCTQGKDDLTQADRRWLEAVRATVREEGIASIDGALDEPPQIGFTHGTSERVAAVFLCAPLRQRHPLVDMLGCRINDEGRIDVNECGRTNVPGCYAAGDAVTVTHQVVLAAASGVCAAMGINEDLLAQEVRSLTQSASPS